MPASIFAASASYAAVVVDKTDGQVLYASGGDQAFNQNRYNLREINKAFRGESQIPSLDVATFKAGGNTYPTVPGSNGQVLTTNGAGSLSWTTVSGGGGYDTMQNNGTPVAQETVLEVDDVLLRFVPGTGKTSLTAPGLVPATRTMSAGTGLTGGGDLSADRSIALADTAVMPGSYTYATINVDQQGRLVSASSGATPALASSQIIAGAGLTGGGDLSADRTLSVVVPLTLTLADAVTNTINTVAQFEHTSSGTTTTGFGARTRYSLQPSGGGTVIAGQVAAVLNQADGSVAYLALGGREQNGGGTDDYGLLIWGNSTVGFSRAGFGTGATEPLSPGVLEVRQAKSSAGSVVDVLHVTHAYASNQVGAPAIKFWALDSTDAVTAAARVYGSLPTNTNGAEEGALTVGANNWFGGFQDVLRVWGGTDTLGALVQIGTPDSTHPTNVTSPLLVNASGGTGNVTDAATFRKTTTGTPVTGIGCAVLLQAEDDAGTVQDAGRLSSVISTVTGGSEKGYTSLSALDGSGLLVEGLAAWGSQRVWLGAVQTTEPDATVVVRTPGSAAAAFYPAMIDKDSAAQASNKLLGFRRSGGSPFLYIESDAGDSVYVNATSTVRLQNNGTTYLSTHASFGVLMTAAVDLAGGGTRRLKLAKGSVASASTIALGSSAAAGASANTYDVTGTTTINTIDATGWTAGSWIVLLPQGSHAYSNSAGNVRCGAGDLAAGAGDVLLAVYDGTNWQLRKLLAT